MQPQDVQASTPSQATAKTVRQTVEVATLADLDQLVALGAELHSISDNGALSYSPEKVRAMFTRLIEAKEGDGVIFVARSKGQVVGGFAGAIAPQWYSEDKVGFDFSFFVQPGARHGMRSAALIQAFVIWCERRGAKQVRVGITTGIDVEGTSRLYRAMGFKDAGVGFSKEI